MTQHEKLKGLATTGHHQNLHLVAPLVARDYS